MRKVEWEVEGIETMNKSIRPWIRRAIVPTIALAVITLLVAGCPMPGGGGEKPASSAKAITAFSFASPAAPGVIDENAKAVAVTVPSGTDVTALVATFTTTGANVKVGSTVQVSGTTANDFSRPVIYTVTAADGSSASYTVTVTVAPENKVATPIFDPPAGSYSSDQSVTISCATSGAEIRYTTDGATPGEALPCTPLRFRWQATAVL